jgi:hypothetical protein
MTTIAKPTMHKQSAMTRAIRTRTIDTKRLYAGFNICLSPFDRDDSNLSLAADASQNKLFHSSLKVRASFSLAFTY